MHYAAAAAAAIAEATKASGAIVRVGPRDFQSLLFKIEDPLIVIATAKIFAKIKYKYLMAYKGLVFFTESSEPLQFGSKVEVVSAKKIWIPS